MTKSEAGRLGGLATKKKMQDNPKYYSEIGLLGGEAILRKKGIEHYRKIGLMKPYKKELHDKKKADRQG